MKQLLSGINRSANIIIEICVISILITSCKKNTTTAIQYPSQQQGSKLVTGATGNATQGRSVALSADGNIAIVAGLNDNKGAGILWINVLTIQWTSAYSLYCSTGANWSKNTIPAIG